MSPPNRDVFAAIGIGRFTKDLPERGSTTDTPLSPKPHRKLHDPAYLSPRPYGAGNRVLWIVTDGIGGRALHRNVALATGLTWLRAKALAVIHADAVDRESIGKYNMAIAVYYGRVRLLADLRGGQNGIEGGDMGVYMRPQCIASFVYDNLELRREIARLENPSNNGAVYI